MRIKEYDTDEKDFFDEERIDNMLYNDEISAGEAGFLMGYAEDD